MLNIILSKSRAESSASVVLERAVIGALAGRRDLRVLTTPHLYDLPPDGESMDLLRREKGDLIVGAWLNSRATFWLLDACGVRGRMGRSPLVPDDALEDATADKPPRTIWCFDLRRDPDPRPLLDEIDRIAAVHGDAPVQPLAEAASSGGNGHVDLAESTRSRWYPVIDRGRCTGCLECLNFCLFGVYGIDRQGRLFVENPDACKDGCPACSRVCPRGAIIFPAHPDPAIAGDASPDAQPSGGGLIQLGGEQPPSEGQEDLDHLVDDLDDADL